MSHNIFAYGTLMFPEVVEILTDFKTVPQSATLHGYSRYAVKDQCFPGIIEDKNGMVEGVLFTEVDDHTLSIFDDFESVIYDRCSVSIVVKDENLNAYAYVVSKKYRHILESKPWHPEDFMKQHCHRYLERCKKYGKRWSQK